MRFLAKGIDFYMFRLFLSLFSFKLLSGVIMNKDTDNLYYQLSHIDKEKKIFDEGMAEKIAEIQQQFELYDRLHATSKTTYIYTISIS